MLSGYTFSAGVNYDTSGTIPNQGATNFTPSGVGTVSIPEGYYDGSGVVEQVSVPASAVLSGNTIAGVAGTMPNQGSPTFTPSNSTITLPTGYYAAGGTITSPFTVIDTSQTLPSGKYVFIALGAAGGSTSYLGGTGGLVLVDAGGDPANSSGYTVTIGTGGAAGSSTVAGGNGGDTTITWTDLNGDSQTATAGGGLGASTTANGIGGTASNTTYNYISLAQSGQSGVVTNDLGNVEFISIAAYGVPAASSAGTGGCVAYWRYG